jgi:hypothetical protein
VPLVALASLLAVQGLLESGRRARAAVVAVALLGPALAWGAYRNVVVGGLAVARDARLGVLPALEQVERHAGRAVAVEHQYLSMALQDAFASHDFFWIQTKPHMLRLVSALARRGESEFLLLRLAVQGAPPPRVDLGQGLALRIRPAGPAGRFRAFACRIERVGGG